MLARFCLHHGAFLGKDLTNEFLDSRNWCLRFVVPLMLSRYFPDWKEDDGGGLQRFCFERLRDTWPHYWRNTRRRVIWGWKFCETLFLMPVIKELFPGARFLHIIRDARDVCLCDRGFFQLTGRHTNPDGWKPAAVENAQTSYFDFCSAVTFGFPGVSHWRGFSVRDRLWVNENRFLLQAQSWVTCVSRARSYGQLLGKDYCEVHYEDFCLSPEVEGARVLKFAGLPPPKPGLAFIDRVRVDRIGKWRQASFSLNERKDFANAEELASPLLQELGYALN
jgi:hypothetical protein